MKKDVVGNTMERNGFFVVFRFFVCVVRDVIFEYLGFRKGERFGRERDRFYFLLFL